MDILAHLIPGLSKEEARHFKLHLQRIETAANRMDEQLFDYIRKYGTQYNDDKIFKKLYDVEDKNNYYRLKNRLSESISGNLAMLHASKSDENKIYQQLLLSQVFLSRQDFVLTNYCLKKAEKLAEKKENFELLDLVYTGFIRLSNDWIELNPEIYINKRNKNFPRLKAIQQLEQVIAILHYKIMKSQNYGKQSKSFIEMVNKTIEQYSDTKELNNSQTFQLKLFKAVSQLLVQKKEFKNLQEFTLKTWTTFKKKNWFDKNNHEQHIQMLIYLVNASFMVREYDTALNYADELYKNLKAYQDLFYKKYILFYYNALVNNYSENYPQKAFEAINELEKISKSLKNNYYEQFIIINRATILYRLKRYNEAIKSLIRYYVHESYAKADIGFKLKVATAELIMQYQSGDIFSCKIRSEQVRKEFLDALTSPNHYFENRIVSLIDLLSKNKAKKNTDNIFKEISALKRETIKRKYNPTDSILDYAVWLEHLKF